jgi:UDP-N-acetylmuramoyl-L-alanyl-D-glutamate--2,6-diaminopimelate ligase
VVVEPDGDGTARLEQSEVPIVHVPDARVALAELAAASFAYPARQMSLVGITGTVGKTSVLAMLSEILHDAGIPVGTIGSLGIQYPGDAIAAALDRAAAEDLVLLLGAQGMDAGAAIARRLLALRSVVESDEL